MKPVFCAEVFTAATTATFSWTPSAGPSAFSLSWSVPAGLYWLGSLASPGIGAAFAAALDTADGAATWAYSVTALSDNLGAVCRLTRNNGGSPGATGTLAATNAAGQAVLWACGYRNTASVALSSVSLGVSAVDSTGIPFGTWWPKAYNTNVDAYAPVSQLVATSGLSGAGTTVATIRQDDGTAGRWWRSFDVVPIAAARCNVRRAASAATPQWAVIAGLTTNPSDAALDNPGWWWSRVADGSYTFAAIEDESLIVSGTPRYSTYRIAYDNDAPVSMAGFKGLREPNLETYARAGALQRFRFAALRVSGGNA
jgi:hypothetical protein